MSQNPGTYNAKIVDYGMYNNDGKESVFLTFETPEGNYTWYGSLKPKQPGKSKGAREISFETLFRCGWDGDIDKFAAKQPCFSDKELQIVVVDEEYLGVTRTKVKYINVPGEMVNRASAQEVASTLGGMKADILKAQQAHAMSQKEPDF